MSGINKEKGNGFMTKLAGQIVAKRYLIFLLTGILLVFSVFSSGWVKVENDLVAYLPEGSDTRLGMEVMNDNFIDFATAKVMVANVSLEESYELADAVAAVDGVQSVVFDGTESSYHDVSALFNITFDHTAENEACKEALDAVVSVLDGYDVYVSSAVGEALSDTLMAEVSVIMVYVVIIILAVLFFTSSTYAEIPVLIITFIVAAVANLGTNFIFGTISFVSNTVTTVLQLALSLDYAIILCNRYKEEHKELPVKEAVVAALGKAIPEIFSSSLTTMGGLAAMLFMQFLIGPDMAICLLKSILFALLSVFLVMPGLLVVFGRLMDKTKHKNFVPKISGVGKFAWATRYIIPPVFVVVIVIAIFLSSNCPYVYGYSGLKTPKESESQKAERLINETFPSSENMVAVIVPSGDFYKEKALLAAFEEYEEVESAMGLANVELMDGYTLVTKLTPRQFSELAGLDYEVAQLLYAAYAAENNDYADLLGDFSGYSVSLMDMFLFVCDYAESGLVELEGEQGDMLAGAKEQIENVRLQLLSDEYSRLVLYLDLPIGGDETYAFLDTLKGVASDLYEGEDVYVIGESSSEYDFKKSFSVDNTVVSVVSILIVLVVLLFTFRSAVMPVLLILVIQGSIWINFSFPTITGDGVMFMCYLIATAIQMGANIDYAIVISSRYREMRLTMPRKDAMIDTLNFAFPTIITSGLIMVVAGVLIGMMTSDAAIAGMGEYVGRGTIISLILVMFVLPQILLLGDRLIGKTSFAVPEFVKQKTAKGKIRIDGTVKGEISGKITGTVHATVEGSVNVDMISGNAEEEKDGEE